MRARRPHLLVAHAEGTNRDQRLDLLVHALAQLPEAVELHLRADAPDRETLALLGQAYGVDGRMRFDARAHHRMAGRPVRPPVTGPMAALVGALGETGEAASRRRGSDEVLAGHRIAVVTNLPTHYRVPLLNRVSRRLSVAGALLRVLFTARQPPSRDWMVPEPIEFDHELLGASAIRVAARDVPRRLARRLRSFSPTLVLVPGFSPTVAVRAAACAWRAGVPYGVWSGAIATRSTWRGEVRRRQRRALLRHASFAISYGHLSAEYMRELVPELPIVYGRNTAPVVAGDARRAADGGYVEVLAVAQAVRRKGLDVAIAAFERLRDLPCRLTIIGGGSELEDLRQRARGLGNVRLLGSVASDRTLEAYRDTDIFLFPTRFDVFGLVLVEAMGAGLATVASSTCGAVADVAQSGRNCMVLEGHDPGDWALAIRRLVEDPQLRGTLGREARDTIERRWTIDHAADAMIAGLRLGILASAHREMR